MKWRSVLDEMPTPDAPIVMFCQGIHDVGVYSGYFSFEFTDEGSWYERSDGDPMNSDYITHWMYMYEIVP